MLEIKQRMSPAYDPQAVTQFKPTNQTTAKCGVVHGWGTAKVGQEFCLYLNMRVVV